MEPRFFKVFDLSSIFYPAWHAGADKPVGFAYDVAVTRVRRGAADADRVIIACDAGKSFRHDLVSTYKAHRAQPEVAMLAQLDRVRDTLDADGYHVLTAPGFEADDIICTCVQWLRRRANAQVEIVSSDKDLLVLLGDGVVARSASSNELVTAIAAREKWGVESWQIRDLLALAGDRADGVPGVPGIGAKRAADLLRRFGTVASLVDALDAIDSEGNHVIRGAVRDTLAGAVRDGSLLLSQRLVTLRDDVPIDLPALLLERERKPLRPEFGADCPEDDMTDTRTQVESAAPVDVAREPEGKPEDATERLLSRVEMPPYAGWSKELEPRTMKQTMWLAGMLHESRAFSGYGSPEKIAAIIHAGRGLGLGAIPSLLGINLVIDKISMSSMLMVGLCIDRDAEYFDLMESTDEIATYETRRKGASRPVTHSFTAQRAQSLGLLEKWRCSRQDVANMLRHRCAAQLARIAYPHVVMGVYIPDELADD
jgi:5'-3' exonuclease